jgi:GH25 family lysozyme M1 (1,4-beta-N-acetylmuramidase)
MNILQALGLQAAAASRYAGYALGPDLSHYNENVNVQTLVDHGCSYIMHKVGDGVRIQAGNDYDPEKYKDPRVDERIQQAFDVTRPDGGRGIPVIVYYYMRFFGQRSDQLHALQYLIHNLTQSKIPGKSYHAIAIDVEEVDKDSDTNIRDKTEEVYAEVLKLGVPVIFYTSNGYLNSESPALRDWLGSKEAPKNLWMAQWPWYRRVIGWDALPQFIPADTVKVLTPGYASWKFWQWAGDVSGFDGCSNSIDLNFYNGSTAALYNWLGYKGSDGGGTTPVEPPVKPPGGGGDTPVTDLTPVMARLDLQSEKLDEVLRYLRHHLTAPPE